MIVSKRIFWVVCITVYCVIFQNQFNSKIYKKHFLGFKFWTLILIYQFNLDNMTILFDIM